VFQLYTDGSSGRKTNSGGYAYVLLIKEGDKSIHHGSGGVLGTTNSRMELTGVIEGLRIWVEKYVDQGPIEVLSDSAYVINCFKERWWSQWIKRDWKTYDGKEVANQDLWRELFKIVSKYMDRITWTHVRGHQGVYWNEICDVMAHEARMACLEQDN